MKVIYHYKNKILSEETAEKELARRYYYRHFKLYVVRYWEKVSNVSFELGNLIDDYESEDK